MTVSRRYFKEILMSIIFEIPISFVLAALGWFFLDVIFDLGYGFKEIWRTVYIVLLSLTVLYTTYVLWATDRMIRKVSKRLEVSYSEVEEAIEVHKLHKVKNFDTWDKEWLERQLVINRASG